MDLGNS